MIRYDYRPLGPSRVAGTNPRAKGTDPRTRLASPRITAAIVTAEALYRPSVPPETRVKQIPHRRASKPLRSDISPVSDSGWRRAVVATQGPCAACGDSGVIDTASGAAICTERVTPSQIDDIPP